MAGQESRRSATRERVLAAARELFDTEGYAATTIRAIAQKAGVSVGSVFTGHTSKSNILAEVLRERLNELFEELELVGPRLRGSTADRLRSLFAIIYAFEAPRTRLFLANLASNFDWTSPREVRPYDQLYEVLKACLRRGIDEGDVDPQTDLQTVVETLAGSYMWTYRLAAWDGADADRMSQVMDRHIGLIAEGFAPRTRG